MAVQGFRLLRHNKKLIVFGEMEAITVDMCAEDPSQGEVEL